MIFFFFFLCVYPKVCHLYVRSRFQIFDREVSLGFGIQRFEKVAEVFGDRQRIKGLFLVNVHQDQESINFYYFESGFPVD